MMKFDVISDDGICQIIQQQILCLAEATLIRFSEPNHSADVVTGVRDEDGV